MKKNQRKEDKNIQKSLSMLNLHQIYVSNFFSEFSENKSATRGRAITHMLEKFQKFFLQMLAGNNTIHVLSIVTINQVSDLFSLFSCKVLPCEN